MKPVIMSYGCSSAAGRGVPVLWNTLKLGLDRSDFISTQEWPVLVQHRPKACCWKRVPEVESAKEILLAELLWAWKEAESHIQDQDRRGTSKLGVILASTKSYVDDLIWKGEEAGLLDSLTSDLLTPLLQSFLERSGLKPEKKLCVSNACASSLSAIYLAERWLNSGAVTDVWVLAADRIGPFVWQGFHCLRALTPEKVRPFAKERSGLQLGDGAAAILLSADPGYARSSWIELQGVGMDTEGYAVTRPSSSGESLKRACLQVDGIQESPPDLIIAHGTATLLNDAAEDQAFSSLFGRSAFSPVITASKACIGHTLGASGAMDLIAACEVLRHQEVFPIANTFEIDPAFQGRYLLQGNVGCLSLPQDLRKVLVTSLGFGGVNAAAQVELKREGSP